MNLISLFHVSIAHFYRWLDSPNWKYFGNHSIVKLPVCRIAGKKNISVGKNVLIEKGARIEAITKYGKNIYTPEILIGDNVCINQNFHCTCADSIVIGDGTSITANCGVFDIIHPYDNININPREAIIITKPIRIGKNCLVGMNSVILPGTILGDHCIVGANSVVSGNYSDYCVLVGSPARIVKRYDFSTQSWRKTNSLGVFLD